MKQIQELFVIEDFRDGKIKVVKNDLNEFKRNAVIIARITGNNLNCKEWRIPT